MSRPLALAAGAGAILKGAVDGVIGHHRRGGAARAEASAAEVGRLREELAEARDEASAAHAKAEETARLFEDAAAAAATASEKAAAASDSLLRRARGDAGRLAAENARLVEALEASKAALAEARAASEEASERWRAALANMCARFKAGALSADDLVDLIGRLGVSVALDADLAASEDADSPADDERFFEADEDDVRLVPEWDVHHQPRLALTCSTRMARLLEAGLDAETARAAAKAAIAAEKYSPPRLPQTQRTPEAARKALARLSGPAAAEARGARKQLKMPTAAAPTQQPKRAARPRVELITSPSARVAVSSDGRVHLNAADARALADRQTPIPGGNQDTDNKLGWLARRKASRAAKKAQMDALAGSSDDEDAGSFRGRRGVTMGSPSSRPLAPARR